MNNSNGQDQFPLLSFPEYVSMELDELPDFPYYDNYMDGNSTDGNSNDGMDDINQMLDTRY